VRLKVLAITAALALPIGHAHADTFYTYEAHGAFEADPFSVTQGFALLTGAVTVNGTTQQSGLSPRRYFGES
jgi:hypothetical protein